MRNFVDSICHSYCKDNQAKTGCNDSNHSDSSNFLSSLDKKYITEIKKIKSIISPTPIDMPISILIFSELMTVQLQIPNIAVKASTIKVFKMSIIFSVLSFLLIRHYITS